MTAQINGPRGHQIPAWLLRFVRYPYEFFQAGKAQFGPTFSMRFPGSGQAVFVSNPRTVQEIFSLDQKSALSIRDSGFLGPIFGDASVVVTTQTKHKEQRRLLSPPFHGASMHACGELVQQATRNAISQWRGSFDAHNAFIDLTLDATLPAVLGPLSTVDLARIRTQLRRTIAACRPALMFVQALRVDLGPLSPWGRFLRERAAFFQLIQDQMDITRATAIAQHPMPIVPRTDLLALLLATRDQDGRPLPDQEILEHVLTMAVLGHESTAAALAWALIALQREPSVKQQLLAELSELPADANARAMVGLPYTSAFCKEVLRLWPAVPEVRRRVLLEPLVLEGHTLPAGTFLAPSIYLMHRDPALYPEPERFNPERFMQKKYTPYEYFPFGGGARSCIGATFAHYEMQIIVATLLSLVDVTVVSNTNPRAIRQNLSVAPEGGVSVKVRSRAQHAGAAQVR